MSYQTLNHSGIQRVLILGHTGFIGKHLVGYFREHSPDIELVGRSLPSLDLTKEEDARRLADLMDLRTAVVMCSGIKKQLGDNLDAFSQNVKMVTNVCCLLKDHPVRRFIYFSSAAVYGEDIHNTNITEDTPIRSTSYYGIAKYTAERLLRKVVEPRKANSLVILRPPLVYGPGDRSRSYGPSGFVWAAVNGEKIILWGDGSEQREFVFVEDLARIVCRLTFHEWSGVVNVASGESWTFKDALRIVSGLESSELQVESRPRTKQKVDLKFCNSILRRLFPENVFTTLDEGIRITWESEAAQRLSKAQVTAEQSR